MRGSNINNHAWRQSFESAKRRFVLGALSVDSANVCDDAWDTVSRLAVQLRLQLVIKIPESICKLAVWREVLQLNFLTSGGAHMYSSPLPNSQIVEGWQAIDEMDRSMLTQYLIKEREDAFISQTETRRYDPGLQLCFDQTIENARNVLGQQSVTGFLHTWEAQPVPLSLH